MDTMKLKVLAISSRLHALEACFLKHCPEMKQELSDFFMDDMLKGIAILKGLEGDLEQDIYEKKKETE